VTETTIVSYDKPLTPEKAKTLDLLGERYRGHNDQPLVFFDSNPADANDGWVALHIPSVFRPTFFEVES